MYDEENDGRFADESPVEVRYPRSKQEEQSDRSQWPWLPGTIVTQCGPDEWYVCVEVRELAVLRDGRRAPRGTASRNLYYPCCPGTVRRSGRASFLAARPLRRIAGWPGDGGPGDPLRDGGRGLRGGRLRGGHLLLACLRAGLGAWPGRHGGPAAPAIRGWPPARSPTGRRGGQRPGQARPVAVCPSGTFVQPNGQQQA